MRVRLVAIVLLLPSGCTAIWGIDDLRYDAAATSRGGGTSTGGTTSTGPSTTAGAGGQGALGGTGGTSGPGGEAGAGGTAPDIVCGDGVIEGTEQCDDANEAVGDGCVACDVECDEALEYEEPINHHCYHLPETSGAWATMSAACESWGGHLATITSAAEHGLVVAFLTRSVWLGASDLTAEGTFVWVTGEPWSFEAWGPTQPDDYNANEDCLQFRAATEDWNDMDCSEVYPGLCEREPPGASPRSRPR